MIQDGAMGGGGEAHRAGFQAIWTGPILAPLEPVHFWTSVSSSVKWGLLSATTSFVTEDSDMGTGAQVHSQWSWALVLALVILS